jgi:Ca-activated chloride channel family protein
MLARPIALLLALLSAPLANAAEKAAPPLELSARLARAAPLAGAAQTLHLRVGLLAKAAPSREARMPINVALVIDRSGSMSGPRIEAAKEAARMAVDRLTSRDIVSVVSYDDRVEVDVPATRASDPRSEKERISRLNARGSTAIWAGLQRGADEVRKFKSRAYVNKIILLSDGLANVGPSRPDEFASLGRELAGEGITVSTIGLGNGYNEDLMAKLAINADGTHKFVAKPADLVQFFAREFDDALSVIAQDVLIEIECAPGVAPNRSLGRQADISGGKATYRFSLAMAGAEQAVLIGIDVPALSAGEPRPIARVRARYLGADGVTRHESEIAVGARATSLVAESDASVDREVMGEVALLTAREQKEEALRLRDAGRHDEAKRKFEETTETLRRTTSAYGIDNNLIRQQLEASGRAAAAPSARPDEWEKVRKSLRETDTNQAGASVRY